MGDKPAINLTPILIGMIFGLLFALVAFILPQKFKQVNEQLDRIEQLIKR